LGVDHRLPTEEIFMKAIRNTEQPTPSNEPLRRKEKTAGPDLARLNETERATGGPLEHAKRGAPDANINTPRGGPVVER
jgi:hypothetical protein